MTQKILKTNLITLINYNILNNNNNNKINHNIKLINLMSFKTKLKKPSSVSNNNIMILISLVIHKVIIIKIK